MFNLSKCNLCGDCLVECQFVDYPREKAIEEFQLLMNGNDAEILKECVTCMACNEYCSKGANPFDLISALQEQKQSITVPPETLGLFAQMELQPSIIIPGDPQKPVLSVCTIEPFIDPQIITHPMFAGMTIVKGAEYFCYYAMPHILKSSILEAKGRQFIDNLAKINAKEIVFLHDECYSMVKKVKEFGIHVPFKATHIVDYLVSYAKKNKKKISSLGKSIAYQRPCSSRISPELDDSLDKLFNLIGVTRVNRVYDKVDAICCGATVIGLGKVDKGMEIMQKNIADALQNGAEGIVCLCTFCNYTLSKATYEIDNFDAIFLVDLLRMSLGEIPFHHEDA